MKAKRKIGIGYLASRLLTIALLFITFFPFVMLINMSVKPSVLIMNDFLGLPTQIYIENFKRAIDFVLKPIGNSIFVCVISLAGILIVVSLSGYAFGRMKFKGKKILYTLVLAVMMIPYTLLIIPNYGIVDKMGLLNTPWALIIPYIAGQQVMGIILAESFFRGLPNDIFEAARIDGASEFYCFAHIAVPLSKPILITVGITSVVSMYNDYIWPTIALTGGDDTKTFCQIVFNNAAGNGTTDMGLIAAAFIIGTIPLLIATASCLKYYVQGMIGGAVKG
ncbi:carbohydrate ABC transporter permease [Faecalicatena sp. AGMB00832]|uniref:Carbohydrate ABC transporter permease n=1 Tax=Faecalicatena faecalis TaxID=2726362 RepID=A0ABS6CZ29_9FIRM|nr:MULTISPECIES: carbohydrate ABC transporter permease [Faecalicatena]MBU3874523.1 carbohydrate ABC transporter permease [Faecalicatena faecalis]MCI6466593.1 carbohydrate ABC transporter permease [Faecalicatena sp.]MDY5617968.1 carbohydrate ABC transporter permease [Lachnospiraceae bacterium]